VQTGTVAAGADEGRNAPLLRATFWVLLSLGGVSCALTLLFLGMRSVMDVGGFCAEGGPYEISRHCPQGVPGVMVGSIWGGLILAGVYSFQLVRHSIPGFGMLLWSGLFLSLGWNFFEFGIDPPGAQGGVVGGWLVCGVLFGLMGGLPLIAVLPSIVRGFLHGASPKPGWPGGFPAVHAQRAAARVTRTAPAPVNLVDELERLDLLYRSGGLTEYEYRLAKERLIAAVR
jgi:hypothetical protein